jgi:hypothetical protein
MSLNPAHNNQTRDLDIKHLQNVQEALYNDYAWTMLRAQRDQGVQAGQRFYGVPSDMHIDRIEEVHFRYGNEWIQLQNGIGDEEYFRWDSDLGITSYPCERWKIWEGEEIELWPIPATNQDPVSLDGTLRIKGIRDLKPLVADTDRADLDDWLIIYTAAAERLEYDNKKLAKVMFTKAERLYMRLRGQMEKRGSFKMFQGGDDLGKGLRGPPRVQYVNVNRP